VGLTPGASSGITGFPPAVVTGGGETVDTANISSSVRSDLITAMAGLAGMASNANFSNVDLGGMTLDPGVYSFDAAASLNGALVLDAKFQNAAFWVFQIGTSFTTAVNSSVTFINLGTNGGEDLGLYWNAGAEIVIGAANDVAGNYLSGTSITFGNQSEGGGRALALAGVSLDETFLDLFGGPGGGDFTGGLVYNQSGDVVAASSAIPEPAATLWAAPSAVLACSLLRRRRAAK
jgi:type VI secretion system secreted protein VgrG